MGVFFVKSVHEQAAQTSAYNAQNGLGMSATGIPGGYNNGNYNNNNNNNNYSQGPYNSNVTSPINPTGSMRIYNTNGYNSSSGYNNGYNNNSYYNR